MFFGLNLTTLVIFFMRWPRTVASLGITALASFYLSSHPSDVNALTGLTDLRDGIQVVQMHGREQVETPTVESPREIHAHAVTDPPLGGEVHVPEINLAVPVLEVPLQQGPVPSYRLGPASNLVQVDWFSELQSQDMGLFHASPLIGEIEAGRLPPSGPAGGTVRGSQNLQRSD